MAKDKANIFKLSEDEQKEYEKDPFFDCTPGAEEFAKGLEGMIATKESPYVLLLESPFGMGKTYFCTRLKKYLDDNFHTIYFSVWENDYLPDPFLAFSKAIFEHFKPKSEESEEAEILFKFFEKFVSCLKVGVPHANIDAKTFLDAFRTNDPVVEFKEELKKYVSNLDKEEKKLVIIVDELDRCRPDYAMKTLEIIKHFFDVEGLYIIVPTNKKSLNKCVLSLYGIDEKDNKDSEYYFEKFFDDLQYLYKPDYFKMVKEYIKEEKLQEVFDSKRLIKSTNKYNSFTLLKTKLAENGRTKKMTIREMTKLCDKVIYYCKKLDGKIYCEYLAYLLCGKLSRNTTDKCGIDFEHPFHSNGKKKKILSFKLPDKIFLNRSFSNIKGFFFPFFPDFQDREFDTYESLKKHLKNIQYKFKNNISFRDPSNHNTYYSDFNNILSDIPVVIEQKLEEIEAYKREWNSDDGDEELKKYYNEVIQDEFKIYLD